MISALLRFKWLILGVVILGSGAGIGMAKLLRNEYTVHATIWIAAENGDLRGSGPIRGGELVPSGSWPDLLSSFKILDKVTRDLQLYVTPKSGDDLPLFWKFRVRDTFRTGGFVLQVSNDGRSYTLATRSGEPIESGAVGDSVGRGAGFLWAPTTSEIGPRRSIEFTITTPREAAVRLRNRLSAMLPEEANLMRLTLRDDNRWRAANSLNALLHEFVATAADLKRRNLVEFSKTLEQQLDYAERELRDADNALETFRARTITLPAEGTPVVAGLEQTRDPVFRNFFEQKLALDDLTHDRQNLERTLADVQKGAITVDAFGIIAGAGAGSASLRSALEEHTSTAARLRAAQEIYTDEHPTVRDLRASLTRLDTQIIPTLVRSLIAQLRDREQDLASRINASSQELRAIPNRTIEEMRLRRNVDSRAALYSTLKSRYEEARLAEASALPDVAILDTAETPLFPSSDRRPRVVALAFIGSLAAAVFLALLLDRTDGRFRYPEQITTEFGLQLVGAVPNASNGRRKKPDPLRVAHLVESFRALRLNILYAMPPGAPTVLTVTSPGVGDGKSLVSANLALSFAEAGYRTLLIDGDVRRGTLHATFGAGRRPGLIEVIKGSSTLAEAFRKTSHDNLTLLPSGSRVHRAPELLGSSQIVEIFEQLRQQFDAIIVDSSPLGAGIDPFVLASMTGNVLLVMRVGRTNRKLTRVKLELLSRFPTNVLGVAMNDVRVGSIFKEYSYLPEYYSSDEGYEDSDEMEAGPATIVRQG